MLLWLTMFGVFCGLRAETKDALSRLQTRQGDGMLSSDWMLAGNPLPIGITYILEEGYTTVRCKYHTRNREPLLQCCSTLWPLS